MISRVTAINAVSLARLRAVVAASMLLVLASCASSGAREAEIAAQQEADAVAVQEEAARVAVEEDMQREAQMRRQQEAETEEDRLQARRDRVRVRREEAEQIKAKEAQLVAEQAAKEQQVRAARAAREREIASLAARRKAKLDRIAELEGLIASTSGDSDDDEVAVMALNEAINVAEDLLDALAAEQAKYENTDATGNTVEPLSKDLITELESRKNELVSRARSQ